MSYTLNLIRENGLLVAAVRAVAGFWYRVRDQGIAKRLGSPGFRARRSPRLLGLSHMRIQQGFHASDFLWMDAVIRYDEHRYDPLLTVGRDARLSDNVHIACIDRITIGDNLLCGSHVLITDHAHGTYKGGQQSDPAVPPRLRPLHSSAPVVIGDNVWLGDSVAVLAGAVIGEGSIVAAHAIVTGTIPPRVIAMGQPAKPVRQWNDATKAWERYPIGQQQA